MRENRGKRKENKLFKERRLEYFKSKFQVIMLLMAINKK